MYLLAMTFIMTFIMLTKCHIMKFIMDQCADYSNRRFNLGAQILMVQFGSAMGRDMEVIRRCLRDGKGQLKGHQR